MSDLKNIPNKSVNANVDINDKTKFSIMLKPQMQKQLVNLSMNK